MESPITQLEQLTLDGRAKRFLKETATWAKFLSILGFIGIGFMVIFSFFASDIFDNMPESKGVPFNLGFMVTIIYLIFAVIYFFPVYYLLQFSIKMKKALLTKNDDTLADAFEVLKSHYKFLGVFFIILISLYILVIVSAIIMGSFA